MFTGAYTQSGSTQLSKMCGGRCISSLGVVSPHFEVSACKRTENLFDQGGT